MKSRIIRLAATMVATIPFASYADAPFHPTQDETGAIYHIVPSKTSKESATRQAPKDPAWELRGGESGWELKQHAYAVKGGRVVHADSFDHAWSPRRAIDPAEIARRDRELSGG